MKKLLKIAVVALFAVSLVMIVPAGAEGKGVRALFESDIISVPTVPPLESGEVYIRADGIFKVAMEGAKPNNQYRVYLMHGNPASPIQTLLGDNTTDSEGNFILTGVLASGRYGSTRVVIFELSPAFPAHYNTGFFVP